MTLFRPAEQHLADTVSRLDYCNPFLPERVELERQALGDEFEEYPDHIPVRAYGRDDRDCNIDRLTERAAALAELVRQRLIDGEPAASRERELYEDLALFVLYHRYHFQFRALIEQLLAGADAGKVDFYPEFEEAARHLLFLPGVKLLHDDPPAHLFAFFFQLNRAFVNIFQYIIGGSIAAAELRATVWQSIFTHDLRRYRRTLYDRMGDIPTLITGPSGTGKELVARAIGLSRYLPFETRSRSFRDDFRGTFYALNLSTLSPTLIESELFGHRKGAFTGALEDRTGWFEVCGASGAVFLDEVGDIDAAIQVKLLRVLQSRTFQRLGEIQTRCFAGKIIAATNRDLSAAMRDGEFREDLYYRICADRIVTPSLRAQLGDDPRELRHLIQFIAARVAGAEAELLTDEVVAFVEGALGTDYPWPGNFRELEQCVRNILIRKEYRPAYRPPSGGNFLAQAAEGLLSAEELLAGYCRLMVEKVGSYSEAARRLGLDRRTVKAKAEGLAPEPPA